jgi:glycosyltransferase involved in cell wall biosynthesis
VHSVVLPVLNEREALPWVLERMPAGYEPIVVDNGSTDGSGSLARALGASVVVEPRPGFGAACFAGLTAARAEVVCFMDCDGSFDPRELPRVADPVAAGEADLVLGARVVTTRRHAGPLHARLVNRALAVREHAGPPHARLANRALAWELRRRTGVRLTDLGPMRAAGRTALLELGLRDRRFGWPLEMVVRAAEAGWTIREVPVSHLPRRGRSKVTGTVRGTLRAVRDMAEVLG